MNPNQQRNMENSSKFNCKKFKPDYLINEMKMVCRLDTIDSPWFSTIQYLCESDVKAKQK